MPGNLPLCMLQNTTPQKLGLVPLALMICLCIGVCGIASAEAGTLNTPDTNPFGTAGQDHDACVNECWQADHTCHIMRNDWHIGIDCEDRLPRCLSHCSQVA